MSVTDLIVRPCTLILRSQSTEEDRYGNEVPGDDELDTVCEIQQRQRSEQDDQPLGRGEWVGFFLPTEDLNGAAAVRVDGRGTFEFDGPPWLADTGSLDMHHWEASLTQVADEEPGS